MNKNLELVLRLQELELLRERLALTGPIPEGGRSGSLDKRIEHVRQQLPGAILSQYDALRRTSPEVATTVSGNSCQSCQGEIPFRIAVLVENSSQLWHCPHCDRFLYNPRYAPDYVPMT